MEHHLSPTIQRLRCLKQPRQIWPKGKSQPLTKQLAQRFCDLISTSLVSTAKLLADHPDLPPFKTLEWWKLRHPWFNTMWKQARQQQAEFLMQHCLDMANSAEPKTAHVVRVRFDIYKFLASKLHPEFYGDNFKHAQPQTTVNVGINISPERLSELRSKLDSTRTALLPRAALLPRSAGASTLKDESRTHSSKALPAATSAATNSNANSNANSDPKP